MKIVFGSAVVAAVAVATELKLVTFDGAEDTTFEFQELNDPVMGGQSTGTWSVNATGMFGTMEGQVVNVPSLAAPGFIKASAEGTFVDVSSALGGNLILKVRSTTADYTGFRVSFAAGTVAPSYSCAGGGSIPFSRGCFKTKFMVPAPEDAFDFQEVRIPFTDFSDMWSPATGEHTAECAEDADVCPTAKSLGSIKRFEVWAEGVDGAVRLDLQEVSAETPSDASSRGRSHVSEQPPMEYDSCSGPVQKELRFGLSGRDSPAGIPVAVDETESLAEAVCCDKRMLNYAEPQFLYTAPDIALYSKLEDGVTTFYDSVCGKPLFQAPVNRSLADFKADTDEHGWPSFRKAEVVSDNVLTDQDTGFVTSVCGTHLGSYLPDEEGPRWCMDLSCLAGNPVDETSA